LGHSPIFMPRIGQAAKITSLSIKIGAGDVRSTSSTSGGILTASYCVRVAVIDEHEVVRAGVQSWLAELDSPLTVSGSFACPAQYLACLQSDREIDVLVTEIQENGHAPDLDSLRELCAAVPAVVVYSRLTAPEIILASLDAGALSFVSKADGMAQLLAAIENAGAARRYVSPRMSEAVEQSTTVGRLNLSDREKQVLAAWLRTDSKEEVARSLQIAPTTVRTHVQRVRIKYANAGRPAPTKSALLARAIEDGIVGLSDLSAVRTE
jgi:DNA-binding NarL/FixJ family response regulator